MSAEQMLQDLHSLRQQVSRASYAVHNRDRIKARAALLTIKQIAEASLAVDDANSWPTPVRTPR